ncbi:MAG: phosphoribosylformylglycinamidine synthase [Saprospiraceae bacterium]|jgi:phosphoribosylformylglycinamidine synthase
MIYYFGLASEKIYAVEVTSELSAEVIEKMIWLFGGRNQIESVEIQGAFIGPRAAMITPWSTNAVEITQNMGIQGVKRIETFYPDKEFDPMISEKYEGLNQDIFQFDIQPEPVIEIDNIAEYNANEGLSLNSDEVQYLEDLANRLGRHLTDSEVFGFSQVNSEHCRHKIFNGTFQIDGEVKEHSLFHLIKKTSKAQPKGIVSAYNDNVAFIAGPTAVEFAPNDPTIPSLYRKKEFNSVISLKAETHNFPTTVEPFSGAATGSGGEIRDRLAGGQGSIPSAGTAVYMTSYSRLKDNRPWEGKVPPRPWLYQTPVDILIKASNGASDFGNKFGQPLIAGSVFTFEHQEDEQIIAYDKVIMQAGGIGYGKLEQALKATPKKGDKVVILGGDNYRIGMGGAAVSSSDTGAFSSGIELNAVQRSNPEMQKRVANVIRALVESDINPIVSIHDHGAGGHLNCLSELVEEVGGHIDLDKLPLGDPTLSAKEIIGNESQERMGLIISNEDLPVLIRLAERERAPLFVVGEVSLDDRFEITSKSTGARPMDLALSDMFGSSPKTIMNDELKKQLFSEITYKEDNLESYIKDVLRLESVACKDWLTNKVDRCVGGRVAKQQCAGPLQLPLNNCAVMALDFEGKEGIATSIGHSPISGLIDARAGARNAVTEALTNIIWAPLKDGLSSVSLSANWMWACRTEGEDARLYQAVEALSDYCIALGINVPTGKDSLSMKQKYTDKVVIAPGTVVVSAAGHCDSIDNIIEPVLKRNAGDIYYIGLTKGNFEIGGTAFGQVMNKVGSRTYTLEKCAYIRKAFNTVQRAIRSGVITAGHDVSTGGLVTTLLEMCFVENNITAQIDLSGLGDDNLVTTLFAENAALVIQASEDIEILCAHADVQLIKIGSVREGDDFSISNAQTSINLSVSALRDVWYETSYLLDTKQTTPTLALVRYQNYKDQPLTFSFPSTFAGKLPSRKESQNRPLAAIIREKGSNSEREMAHALYLAGFDVRDVHMTDLINGRETLEDVQFLGAVGGFSNSDVLGSAKGWAGSFKYNPKAKKALGGFFARPNVLSIGICNGCQLMVDLDLLGQEGSSMDYNDSGKHESAFTSVTIPDNNSVMLSNLAGTTLGVWISHGEGKFILNQSESAYNIVGKYGYESYPSNPNGSDFNTAMLCSADGRHLVTMPHIERSIFPWNWAYYPDDRKDEVSPWLQAFVNARTWLESNIE